MRNSGLGNLDLYDGMQFLVISIQNVLLIIILDRFQTLLYLLYISILVSNYYLLFKFLHKWRRVDRLGVIGAVWALSDVSMVEDVVVSTSDAFFATAFSLHIRSSRRSLRR